MVKYSDLVAIGIVVPIATVVAEVVIVVVAVVIVVVAPEAHYITGMVSVQLSPSLNGIHTSLYRTIQ